MKRFLITVDTGFSGADHEEEVEFEDSEWAAMTEEQRNSALWDAVQDTINNNVSGSWEEL